MLKREYINAIRPFYLEKNLDTISVYEGRAYLERGTAFLKPDGMVPRVPEDLTPESKLSRLFAILGTIPSKN